MISVTFWNFAKRENSTKRPTTTGQSFPCKIKSENSLTAPIIELDVGASAHPTWTYCYVQNFSRYYFVRDWKWASGFWFAECEVDVLATYKTEIGSQSMYVERSASYYDGNITDDLYAIKDIYNEAFVQLDQGWSPYTNGAFVLSVTSKVDITDITSANPCSPMYYQASMSQFQQIFNGLLDNSTNIGQWNDPTSDIQWSQAVINAISNPYEYITSARWFPRPMTCTNSGYLNAGNWQSGIQVGKVDLPQDAYWYPTQSTAFSIPKHPLASVRGEYMNLAPFSRYFLQWGGFFIKELDATLLAPLETFQIQVVQDYGSGMTRIRGYEGDTYKMSTNTMPLFDIEVKESVDFPILHRTGSDAMNTTASFVAGSGLAFFQHFGGDGGFRKDGYQKLSRHMNPVLADSSAGGGFVYNGMGHTLKAVFFSPEDENVAEFGRPLMSTKTINTLSGFVKCGHQDTQIDCLSSEREQIEQYMTDGFFYE